MDGQRPLSPPPPPEEQESLADDILEGADLIAAFMWGSASKRRKVYHLMETSRLPLFKIGNVWCARKSRLKEYIREQEDRNAAIRHVGKADKRRIDDRKSAPVMSTAMDGED